MKKLSVSENTPKQWGQSYVDLQKAIMNEVAEGRISKESYLLDFCYDERDNKDMIRFFTPPTADEVCEAIEEDFKKRNIKADVHYNQELKVFGLNNRYNVVAALMEDGLVKIIDYLEPKTIQKIAQFYEHERKEEE